MGHINSLEPIVTKVVMILTKFHDFISSHVKKINNWSSLETCQQTFKRNNVQADLKHVNMNQSDLKVSNLYKNICMI
jgi:hypothetical protein